ncbi:unnamed protein product [Blepharisma stoltei]|uniref:Uncharacterized protein n=1 Tax=Blepharisma stoltei TaxID=1481888 RepID=A0AAU9JF92_9CILI|nr:unnamed protein product [Blepharisma stoltei]
MSQPRKRAHILPQFSAKDYIHSSVDRSLKSPSFGFPFTSHKSRLVALNPKTASPTHTPKTTKARSRPHRFASPYSKPRTNLNRSFSSSTMKRNHSEEAFTSPKRTKDRMNSLALDFSQCNTFDNENLLQNSTLCTKLNGRLAKLTPANKEKQFLICKEALQELIDSVKPLSDLLESIKKGYETYIDEKETIIEAQRKQIYDLRGVTQVSTMASDASRTPQGKYIEIPQSRLKKSRVPSNPKFEVTPANDKVNDLNKQINDMKQREKVYQNCLSELIKKGYPVNQALLNDGLNRKNSKTPHPIKPRLEEIPKLDLTRLETKKKYIDSKDQNISLTESKSGENVHMQNGNSENKPKENRICFQEEFMSKFQEFSESWRNLIQDQTRT